jgi:serine/threonine-protein kinase
VDGDEAAGRLKNVGPFPVAYALDVIDQAMRAASYMHSRGVVHRNIKPGDLLIGRSGDQEMVKLADFGLAFFYQGSLAGRLTTSAQVLGTLGFMPPEQVLDSREATPLADQYALAATLYFLLTGTHVLDFPSNNYCEGLRMVLEEMRVPITKRRRDIPDRLAAIIHRGLELKPENRFPDVEAMRQALRFFRQVAVAP